MSEKRQRDFENIKKIVDNEFAYYEEHWPFVRPETFLQTIMHMMGNLRIVRRVLGGTWVKGELFGIWMKTNKFFEKEWLEKREHETWK